MSDKQDLSADGCGDVKGKGLILKAEANESETGRA